MYILNYFSIYMHIFCVYMIHTYIYIYWAHMIYIYIHMYISLHVHTYSCVFLCRISSYNIDILPFINEVGHHSLGHHLHGDFISSFKMETMAPLAQVKHHVCNLIIYKWVQFYKIFVYIYIYMWIYRTTHSFICIHVHINI